MQGTNVPKQAKYFLSFGIIRVLGLTRPFPEVRVIAITFLVAAACYYFFPATLSKVIIS
jgi:hypothetical protein